MSLPCAAYNFGLLSSLMFCCVEPQKNVKPNKRAVSTSSTRIAIILNPSAGPLRRSSQNVQAHPEKEYTSELLCVCVCVRVARECR